MNRQKLYDRLWSWMEPDTNFYCDIIEALLETLTDEQLAKFVAERCDEDDE